MRARHLPKPLHALWQTQSRQPQAALFVFSVSHTPTHAACTREQGIKPRTRQGARLPGSPEQRGGPAHRDRCARQARVWPTFATNSSSVGQQVGARTLQTVSSKPIEGFQEPVARDLQQTLSSQRAPTKAHRP